MKNLIRDIALGTGVVAALGLAYFIGQALRYGF